MPPSISYGSPGHRGVTHLVAIGDTEDSLTLSTEKKTSFAGIAVMAIGAVVGSPRMFWGGAGVAAGIMFARWWRSRHKVEVSTP